MRYSDYCILTRTNSQAMYFAKQIMQRGHPVQMLGSQFDMMKDEPFRVMMALWKCVINPYDTLHAQYLMTKPDKKYSSREIRRLKRKVYSDEVSLIELLDGPIKETWEAVNSEMTLSDAVETTATGLGLPTYYEQADRVKFKALREIYPILIDSWTAKYPEHDSVAGFLDWYALSAVQDEYDAEKDAITVATIHAAKGLEWAKVFVAGMQQGRFPSRRGEIDEERRLAYVAFTRPQAELYISGSRTGENQFVTYEPSQFLQEIR